MWWYHWVGKRRYIFANTRKCRVDGNGKTSSSSPELILCNMCPYYLIHLDCDMYTQISFEMAWRTFARRIKKNKMISKAIRSWIEKECVTIRARERVKQFVIRMRSARKRFLFIFERNCKLSMWVDNVQTCGSRWCFYDENNENARILSMHTLSHLCPDSVYVKRSSIEKRTLNISWIS